MQLSLWAAPRPLWAARDLHRYTIADLERETGISPRNIRYYHHAEGFSHQPTGEGWAPHSTADHLLRLKYINKLKQDNLPLAEMRKQMEGAVPGKAGRCLAGRDGAAAQDRWRRFTCMMTSKFMCGNAPAVTGTMTVERAVEEIAGHAEIVLFETGYTQHEQHFGRSLLDSGQP